MFADPVKSVRWWLCLFVAPLVLAVAALMSASFPGGMGSAPVFAQDATPESGAETLVLVEHNDNETVLDLGEPGQSAGDLLVWGPNPLYDEANKRDTGATSQGTCVDLHAPNACLVTETVVFADGSTLHFQGIERGAGELSMRVIVGGSGRYLGATGTLAVSPTEDERLWTKAFTIRVP